MDETRATERPLFGWRRAGVGDLIEWALFSSLLAITGYVLTRVSHTIVFDQGFIKPSFSFAAYPGFDAGITSNLLTGIYNRVFRPDPAIVDLHVRLLAMLLYATAAFGLAREVLKKPALRLVFLIFLFSSRYCMLWLSSELFAGAFLCLAILALLRAIGPKGRRWDLAAGLLLALLGNTKPDLMIVSAGLLAATWTLAQTAGFRRIALTFGVSVALLWLPGLVARGGAFFDNRAFSAFSQHYSVLVFPHQLMPNPPDAWYSSRLYIERMFPGVQTVAQAVSRYYWNYCDFVFLSMSLSLRLIVAVFGPLALFAPVALFFSRKGTGGRSEPFNRLAASTAVNLVPILMLAYLHVRYMARFYPLVMIWALGQSERMRKTLARGVVCDMLLLSGLAWNAFGIASDLKLWRPEYLYWFPN